MKEFVCVRALRCFQGGKYAGRGVRRTKPDGGVGEVVKERLGRNFKATVKILVFNLSYMGNHKKISIGQWHNFTSILAELLKFLCRCQAAM